MAGREIPSILYITVFPLDFLFPTLNRLKAKHIYVLPSQKMCKIFNVKLMPMSPFYVT